VGQPATFACWVQGQAGGDDKGCCPVQELCCLSCGAVWLLCPHPMCVVLSWCLVVGVQPQAPAGSQWCHAPAPAPAASCIECGAGGSSPPVLAKLCSHCQTRCMLGIQEGADCPEGPCLGPGFAHPASAVDQHLCPITHFVWAYNPPHAACVFPVGMYFSCCGLAVHC
jgi:hypothetical protein